MANEFQAGKMILSDIGMFNEAATLFRNVVEPAVLGAIDECVEAFAKDEHWVGGFEVADELCWLAPKEWNVGADSADLDCNAWFQISNNNDPDDNDYWTAAFCNEGSAGGEAGFMFYADAGRFGKKTAWNKFFSTIDENAIAELKKLGFKNTDNDEGYKTFFLPIQLDAMALAETWGKDGEFSDTDSCFDPVKAALEMLKRAWPLFDSVLKACPVKP